MASFYGSAVKDSNVRLRMFLFVFFGLIAFASVLFWKEKAHLAADYVDFPQARHLSHLELENN